MTQMQELSSLFRTYTDQMIKRTEPALYLLELQHAEDCQFIIQAATRGVTMQRRKII